VSEKINDGGPAFPVQDAASWQSHGMTRRDYFAAAAMQGILGVIDRDSMRFLDSTPYPAGKLASAACNLADALIEALEEAK
jgi:hypothetical protein